MSLNDYLFASTAGQRIPGGCDWCDANQTTGMDHFGILHITVHHDDWCPFLARHEARRSGGTP